MVVQDSEVVYSHGITDSTRDILNDGGPAIATASTTCSHDMHFTENEKTASPTTYATDNNSRPLPYTTNHHRTSTASSFRNQNRQPHSASPFDRDSIAMPFTDGYDDALRRGSVDVSDHRRSVSTPGTARKLHTNSPHKTEFLSSEMIRPMSGFAVPRRASRKPVPQYDEPDVKQSPRSLTDTDSPDSIANTNNSSQSSSGDPRSVHYLMPDLPQAGDS